MLLSPLMYHGPINIEPGSILFKNSNLYEVSMFEIGNKYCLSLISVNILSMESSNSEITDKNLEYLNLEENEVILTLK